MDAPDIQPVSAKTKAQPASRPVDIPAGPRTRSLRILKQWITDGVLIRGERMPAEETLAEKLGIARTTVRRLLSDLEREGFIQVDGRRRIVAGPPTQARSLTMSRTVAMLGALPPDARIRTEPGWSHQIRLGVADGVRAAGLHLLELAPESLDEAAIEHFATEGVRGLVAFRHGPNATATARLVQALREAKLPVVVYGYEPDIEQENTIASDHASGSYQLTRFLIERGCRRILRMWSSPGSADRPNWMAGRDAGYERAVTEAGLPVLSPAGITAPPDHRADTAAFEFLSRLAMGYLVEYASGPKRVDAILAPSDGEAYAITAACRRLGLEPDRDVLIAGYDNYWKETPWRQLEPLDPVATVDKHNFAIGRQLVEMLLGLTPTTTTTPQHRTLEPELVILRDTRLQH